MTEEQLDELRDYLKAKLHGQGFILLTGDESTYIISNVCEDHFLEIMERVLEAGKKQDYKNERT